MTRSIVLGTGGHCRAVLSIILNDNLSEEIQIVELNSLKEGENILGHYVTSEISSFDFQSFDKSTNFYFAIGDNSVRHLWWEKLNKMGLSTPNLISSRAFVDGSANLGNGNVVCPNVFIGPESSIGDNNIINTAAVIEHEVSIGSNCHIAPSSTIAGRCAIKDFCFIGAGSTIIHNLTIASNTTLGAGSTLISSIADCFGTHVGSPAKRVSDRS